MRTTRRLTDRCAHDRSPLGGDGWRTAETPGVQRENRSLTTKRTRPTDARPTRVAVVSRALIAAGTTPAADRGARVCDRSGELRPERVLARERDRDRDAGRAPGGSRQRLDGVCSQVFGE